MGLSAVQSRPIPDTCCSELPKTGGFPTWIIQMFDEVLAWQDRRASRLLLSKMSRRDLADLGLDLSTLREEVNKFFWQR